uniref:C2H2-type domain-containing protein n=1 Tax=Branchiostoma floridae TaxID=7739 RepID=C3XUT1_BRAFL|eukprot:XP_002612147.1 hypothetical protein BRAFLDRAFT_88886 [Branchiostoma floridae]
MAQFNVGAAKAAKIAKLVKQEVERDAFKFAGAIVNEVMLQELVFPSVQRRLRWYVMTRPQRPVPSPPPTPVPIQQDQAPPTPVPPVQTQAAVVPPVPGQLAQGVLQETKTSRVLSFLSGAPIEHHITCRDAELYAKLAEAKAGASRALVSIIAMGEGFCREEEQAVLNDWRINEAEIYRREHCGKSFGRRHTLVVDVRVHTRERPYSCEHCDKSFARKHILEAHECLEMSHQQ